AKYTREIRTLVDTLKYTVLPWQEFAKSFYEMIQAKFSGNYVVNLIIGLIVGIGVLNTVLMSVLERTREYGVLKAVGTKPVQVFKLIMFEVLILAVGSIALGAVLGIGVNFFFSKVGIPYNMDFDVSGFIFEEMTSRVTAQTIYLPAAIVFFTAMLVGIFPAIFAAKTEPAKTMRM
ncbi:MAG: ABC transporter permease, partial [bacterium]